MRTLVVLTVGQTDVQLVLDGVRHELGKEHCADLHDEIERRTSEWRVVDAPDRKAGPVDTLPDGELILCAPKLDAVLGEVVPTTALLLETCRDSQAASGDPRFAGTVLEARLKAKGVDDVRHGVYLQGDERLEDCGEPRDAVIRREVVGRLEDAVRTTIAAMNPSRVVLAATGGFPVVSNLVEEIVGLHAPASAVLDVLEVADGAQTSPPGPDRAVRRTLVPEPVVSFQARRRVLQLIEKGNLLGAWAVAEPLHSDETEREWTKVIEWMACFASSLPIPEDCDISVLKHPRMAARAALRVELALRGADVPRAVHGTISFFEAALWDHLYERLDRDPKRPRFFRFKDGAEPDEQKRRKLFREGDGSPEDRKRPFEGAEGSGLPEYYRVYDDEACAGRLAKHYLEKAALQGLCSRVSKIRDLRNDVAHNEPTPALMNDAHKRIVGAGLWSEEGRFLTQRIVRDVLEELSVEDPPDLCEGLIGEVRNRLLGHRLGRNKANE